MNKVALIVLDGLGLNPLPRGNAISRETMPFFHSLIDQFGLARLAASGPEVGLAEGQAGNSEVGHLTIGAGRVVGTTLTRIRNGFDSGTWSRSPVWSSLRGRPRVHVAGLLSGAGVHSHYSSLIQTALLAKQAGVGQVVLHLFLDGVDSPRGSAPQWLQAVREACQAHPEIVLGSVSGRQWACDRSGSFKITAQCVDGLFGKLPGAPFSDSALAGHLKNEGESSFPVHYGAADRAVALGEPLILTHHRADRTCQLARALNEITELHSLVELEGAVPPERVFFPIEPLHNGLVDTLAQNGIAMSRVAETCKFPHVTFFLNGMRHSGAPSVEVPSIAEDRIPQQPEMSLAPLTQTVCRLMQSPQERALAVNIANLDQVGHTGHLELTRRAAKHVDESIEILYAQARIHGWKLLLTADHGNADQMLDDAGRPLGSHSMHPVPLVIADPSAQTPRLHQSFGTIAHIAPTFLALCGIAPPDGMAPALVDIK